MFFEFNKNQKETFKRYNKKYFENKLQDIKLFLSHNKLPNKNIMGAWHRNNKTIEIDLKCARSCKRIGPFKIFNYVLLHEMCHAAVSLIDKRKPLYSHGKTFNKWHKKCTKFNIEI